MEKGKQRINSFVLKAGCIVLVAAVGLFPVALAQQEDSLAMIFSNALSRLSTPKLQERKQLVRSFQRKGYAATLLAVVGRDGIGALLSHGRTRLQLEYSLSHEPILVDITAGDMNQHIKDSILISPRTDFHVVLPNVPRQHTRIGVDIDWAFPEDPWKEGR